MINQPIDVLVPVKDEFEKLRICCRAIRDRVPVNHLIIATANNSRESVRTVESLADIPLIDETVVGVGATRSLGLSAIETEYYGSIDADVIISKEWYSWCLETMREPAVAACQGYQKSLGKYNDMWAGPLYRSGWHCDQGNTMLRTKVIKMVGIPTAIQKEDAVLRSQLITRGYRWVVNPNLISIHLQNDLDLWRHWFNYGKLTPVNWIDFIKYLIWLPRWMALENRTGPIDFALYRFLALLIRETGALVGQYSKTRYSMTTKPPIANRLLRTASWY